MLAQTALRAAPARTQAAATATATLDLPAPDSQRATQSKVRDNKEKDMATANGRKRYNLALPEELFDEVQRLADRRGVTVVELFRRFIKLGLIAMRIEETEGAALIIREGNVEREIVLV